MSWLKVGYMDVADPAPFPTPRVEVPPEVNVWMGEAIEAMVEGLRALDDPGLLPPGFLIDLSQPPYTVPCPTCLAFALEACRHEKREGARQTPFGPIPGPWPGTSRMVKEPHAARARHWEDHPEFRVTPIR